MINPRFSYALYWSLPGPMEFINRVARTARTTRATAISLSNRDVPGLWDKVREGLGHAFIEKIVDLSVTENTNIEADIGKQFGRECMTAGQLAEHQTGLAAAVILRPKDDNARKHCEVFFRGFTAALEHTWGDVHLILGIRDGACQEDLPGKTTQVIAFDGGLTPAEMLAYVSLRMIERPGPGSTRLLSALVAEYAGFDATLAEQLIAMPDSELYALPNSLGPLLEHEPLRWSRDDWAEGTFKKIDGQNVIHPLREWYIANNDDPRRKEMEAAARRRFWRACVKALTPWLEERRASVMEILKKPLDDLQRSKGGSITRPVGQDREIAIDRDEIEYNNIVGMVRYGDLIIPQDERSKRTFAVCCRAKSVRDAMAHLRAPSMEDVLDLVSTMDLLLPRGG